jgi:hypothetical protein
MEHKKYLSGIRSSELLIMGYKGLVVKNASEKILEILHH